MYSPPARPGAGERLGKCASPGAPERRPLGGRRWNRRHSSVIRRVSICRPSRSALSTASLPLHRAVTSRSRCRPRPATAAILSAVKISHEARFPRLDEFDVAAQRERSSVVSGAFLQRAERTEGVAVAVADGERDRQAVPTTAAAYVRGAVGVVAHVQRRERGRLPGGRGQVALHQPLRRPPPRSQSRRRFSILKVLSCCCSDSSSHSGAAPPGFPGSRRAIGGASGSRVTGSSSNLDGLPWTVQCQSQRVENIPTE